METKEIYEELGIRKEIYDFGENILKALEERFKAIDETAEYNQLKVISAFHREIRWKESMPTYLRPRTPWCGHRSPAGPTLWPLPSYQT